MTVALRDTMRELGERLSPGGNLVAQSMLTGGPATAGAGSPPADGRTAVISGRPEHNAAEATRMTQSLYWATGGFGAGPGSHLV
ncbi:hypothetical protein ACFO1B_49500 [Dactylosporangium siamense]|uniref:Uncharacterized protein n=1 Tax=Dactylosporangium siamense TaxID=685454 RepID=A0A919PYI7_9ACTN|nr:hypothetical protein [Dactylosporangium siamense]GIG51992.1 hypothetical protein Dsi01nite_100330 [Dactylosporangium siamense]